MHIECKSLSILVVCQYFYPENFGVNSIVAELQQRGHKVTVLTGMPNYPSGVFADGYGGWKVRREIWNGADVIRIPIIARGHDSRLKLALNYLSYAIYASLLAPFVVKGRFDTILAYQLSPVTAALPAIVIKLITGANVLLWVQDIWPESLTATGAVKTSLVLSPLRTLVRFIYRHCSIIAVQSRRFVDFVRPLASAASDIRYLPNTADRIYRPVEAAVNAPERRLFRPGFNIVFAGNLGLAQDLETILGAIIHLRDRKDIQWVFIGNGSRRAWLEQQIEQQNLTGNAQTLGSFPPEKMPYLFSLADALLVTLRDERIFSLTVPSKLQTYLACGRPILGAISGEAAEILTTAGAGLAVSPNDPERLAQMALSMAQMTKEQLDAFSRAALEYDRREFNRDQWMDRLEIWLGELSKKSRPGNAPGHR